MKITKPGVYRLRCGGEIEIPYINQNNGQYPVGHLLGVRPTWTTDGMFYNNTESPLDLVEYLRPLPTKMCLGWWQARNGEVYKISNFVEHERYSWQGALEWRSDGQCASNHGFGCSLWNYLGNGDKPDFTLYQ